MAIRTLIAATAFLAVFQGSSAAAAVDILPQAFLNATAPRPLPKHSVYFHISNATAVKQQVQSALQAYLADMGMTVDMMAARTLRQLYQQESNYFKHFEYLALHPEQLVPTSYDSALPYLGALYRRMVSLVKDGASATSRATPQVSRNLHQVEYSEWSPEDSYVKLPEVVGSGLSELRSWVDNLLVTGLPATNSQVAAIMKKTREEQLIPYVESAQFNARRASSWYEHNFQQYSSPEVYQDFVAARQELWDLQLVA
ncbi:uncharacterized protein LOC126109378 [Schistocerca cancellata]|uniref:uncharacterized protein LOC126109378 n=1 Tax=Schistocerca cancellata TaxID=274614 RepID=UPI002118E27B|nr:uncharacterized protein LOC126109378 [Schistocerca cancellata]